MAITFSENMSAVNILPAYNNNIVEFSSDSIPVGETIVKGELRIQSNYIGVISSYIYFDVRAIDDIVKFNFRDVVKVMFDNQFKDDVSLDSYFELDTSYKGSLTIRYTVTFSDNTTESVTNLHYFNKEVQNIGSIDIKESLNNFSISNNLTVFKGYPFSINYHGQFSSNVTVTNTDNSETFTELNLPQSNGYRLFFLTDEYLFKQRVEDDSGAWTENQCWTDRYEHLLLEGGYNNILIEPAGYDSISLTVRLLDQCEGTYLKWFNEDGSWSYWLFSSIHKTNVKTKTLATYNTDFLSIGSTFDTSLITGKTAVETRKLTAEQLTEDEVLQVKDIATSPRVYMYNGSQNDMTSTWQTVKVKDGNFLTESTKTKVNGIRIDIEINKFTQY